VPFLPYCPVTELRPHGNPSLRQTRANNPLISFIARAGSGNAVSHAKVRNASCQASKVGRIETKTSFSSDKSLIVLGLNWGFISFASASPCKRISNVVSLETVSFFSVRRRFEPSSPKAGCGTMFEQFWQTVLNKPISKTWRNYIYGL